MTGHEIRRRFLEHFRNRDHLVLPSYPLIPQQDPTTLFISAGMQPLQPYYQGVSSPPAPRLASCQKCFRTGDLEEVGKTDRHNTFFEMLGNFAPTGGYFKATAIPLAWELVTGGFGLPVERLRVTIHPTDDEAFEIWRRHLDERFIHRNQENWWGLELGPCGPDSEIWWDRGETVGCGRPDCQPDHCERFLEFWNLVFPQFNRQPDGSLPPLPKPAIDTGMGLERISTILQDVPDLFETDLFRPLIDFVRESSQESRITSERVLADHLRAMTFVIGDGVLPGTEGRGYVLRRVIRRALLHARGIRMGRPLSDGVAVVIREMGSAYPELASREQLIRETVQAESDRFARTLEQGMEVFETVAVRNRELIPGTEAFKLHDTFGFPLELTQELARERGLALDSEGFNAAMEAQRQRSRSSVQHHWSDLKALPRSRFVGYQSLSQRAVVTAIRVSGTEVPRASEGAEVEIFLDQSPFYGESGGQVGDTGEISGPEGSIRVDDTQRPVEGVIIHLGRVVIGTVAGGESVRASVDAERRGRVARHHSATHLLHKALRETVGEGAVQRGSWVGPTHTTFDFALNRALLPAEVQQVAERISGQVRAALPFTESLRPYQEAVQAGAMHLFEEKYGDVVRVVCFGDWTCELCGGTHVPNTAEVGTVVITGEASVGAGVRRIEMVVGEAADQLVRLRLDQLSELARSLGVPPDQVPGRVAAMRADLKLAQRENVHLREQLAVSRRSGDESVTTPGTTLLLVDEVADPAVDLKGVADIMLDGIQNRGVVLLTRGPQYVLKVGSGLSDRLDATKLKALLGPGGGRPQLVQGKLDRPREQAIEALKGQLG